MKLFVSPHNDDEALFGSYTLLREKPLVLIVTDAHIQTNRGEIGCDAETRWQETIRAMKVLGCAVTRLGIPDNHLTEEGLKAALRANFANFREVYCPALQGGNIHHDMVHNACKEVFGDACIEYTTYSKEELWTKGNTEVVPTEEEITLKSLALACYQSQIALQSTVPHFLAVMGKSEWLNKNSSI